VAAESFVNSGHLKGTNVIIPLNLQYIDGFAHSLDMEVTENS